MQTSIPDHLPSLPLILAGPLLRRTEPDAVTVWIALKTPCKVSLAIYQMTPDGKIAEFPLFTGQRSTLMLGRHLHVVAVTARIEESGASQGLQAGKLYAYDLAFHLHGASESGSLSLQAALNVPQQPAISISYFDHQLPTFCLPPQDLNNLQLVQGSCRKLHGAGHDTLPLLDDLIAQAADSPNHRPHQLFLTGDQIYGDDVADPLLWMMRPIIQDLFGWEESLPESVAAADLQPGQRSTCAELQGGLTAGLRDKPHCASSHLFFFQEYCTLYLLSWSPALWTTSFPRGRDLFNRSSQVSQWDKTVKILLKALPFLGKVRRALANIPTYMIFDDHDISDDWYLNQAWCLRVLGKPLGRQTVQNGLLAYALFQAWGNTPDQFTPGQRGDTLLQATQTWIDGAGQHQEAATTIARYLGLPSVDPYTELPKLQLDGDVLILKRDEESLDWHYTVRGDRHQVIVLDTRTWRGYSAQEGTTAAPMLLSPAAFQQQLEQPLNHSPSTLAVTLIVAPTNLITLQLVDWIQHWMLKRGQVFDADVGDAWNIHRHAFFRFLQTVTQHRLPVVVLSGDIHYGSAVRITNWSDRKPDQPALPEQEIPHRNVIQLTASAIKNSEEKTQLVHTKIKSLLPEGRRDFFGWQTSSEILEVQEIPGHLQRVTLRVPGQHPTVKQIGFHHGAKTLSWLVNHFLPRHSHPTPPHTHYQIEWIPRQPARTPPWGTHLSWLTPRPPSRHMGAVLGRAIALLWRNRWLQEGREVVGRNNLGVVHFAWDTVSEGETVVDEVTPNAVYQDLYWYALWVPNRVVFSRFYAPFQTNVLD